MTLTWGILSSQRSMVWRLILRTSIKVIKMFLTNVLDVRLGYLEV